MYQFKKDLVTAHAILNCIFRYLKTAGNDFQEL